MTLIDLLLEIGTLIGGVPGHVIRYAAHLIDAKARVDAKVAERVARARIVGLAAGQAAYEASKAAGK